MIKRVTIGNTEVFERLEKVRNALYLNQSNFAQLLNLSRSGYSKLKSGTNVTAKVIESLCSKTNVSQQYIASGIGSMFVENSTSMLNEQAAVYIHPAVKEISPDKLVKLLEINNDHLRRLINSIEVRDENEKKLIENERLIISNLNMKEEISRINAGTINNLANELLKFINK